MPVGCRNHDCKILILGKGLGERRLVGKTALDNEKYTSRLQNLDKKLTNLSIGQK
jgi:hypothetical protein